MLDRRDFLWTTSLGALGALCAAPRSPNAAASRWAPYRDTLCIDGAGGLDLFFMKDDDPAVARDFEEARRSGLSAIVLTTAPSGYLRFNDAAFERVKNTLVDWKKKIVAHPDTLRLVEGAGDLQRAQRDRRIGVVFTFQGTEPLGEDPDRVAMFRQLGVRVIQLTHNQRNLVGDGCMEPGNAGLSNFGHAVVERLNAQKIVVDLAHGAQRTISEGIKASKAPALISHTGCRALADLPRNTGDAELRALADRGGVAGIIFWPYLRVDTQPMAIDVIRHIEHAVNVCGEDHVGLGTDGGVASIQRTPQFETENREFMRQMKKDGIFEERRPDDLYMFIPDLNVANRFEVLAAKLSERGHSDARIAKILGGNFARVMDDVWG